MLLRAQDGLGQAIVDQRDRRRRPSVSKDGLCLLEPARGWPVAAGGLAVPALSLAVTVTANPLCRSVCRGRQPRRSCTPTRPRRSPLAQSSAAAERLGIVPSV